MGSLSPLEASLVPQLVAVNRWLAMHMENKAKDVMFDQGCNVLWYRAVGAQ